MSDKGVRDRFVYEAIAEYWAMYARGITPTSFRVSRYTSYALGLRIEDELGGLVTFKGLVKDSTLAEANGKAVIYWQT